MKTIEQLEQEKADILAKALQLAKKVRDTYGPTLDISQDIAAIEALKPEPEMLRLWVNEEQNGAHIAYRSRDRAIRDGEEIVRLAVPMIEIRPIGEVPTWEEWRAYDGPHIIKQGERELYRLRNLGELCEVHNKEMKGLQSFINQLLVERGGA